MESNSLKGKLPFRALKPKSWKRTLLNYILLFLVLLTNTFELDHFTILYWHHRYVIHFNACHSIRYNIETPSIDKATIISVLVKG